MVALFLSSLMLWWNNIKNLSEYFFNSKSKKTVLANLTPIKQDNNSNFGILSSFMREAQHLVFTNWIVIPSAVTTQINAQAAYATLLSSQKTYTVVLFALAFSIFNQ